MGSTYTAHRFRLMMLYGIKIVSGRSGSEWRAALKECLAVAHGEERVIKEVSYWS
jgi:hypothetical protein